MTIGSTRPRTAAGVRLLTDADLPEVTTILERDPVAACFVASRVSRGGLTAWRTGAETWGFGDTELQAVCWSGANLVPVGGDERAWRAFAARARRGRRRCTSIVGPARAVEVMWDELRRAWGPAREERWHQPLMLTREVPRVVPDPFVRRTRPEELDLLLPAAVAMFREEVGVSPLVPGSTAYVDRLRELVVAGRSYVRFEGPTVAFKAEVGSLTPHVAQVQGVWVHPERRGQGLGVAGMAAVVSAVLAEQAPAVSLYVNDFNAPARRVYERVGMTQVGEMATVLL